MDICNHIIDDKEIIGIGPLMIEHSSDNTIIQLYGTRKLFFELHTIAGTRKLVSDSYDVIGHPSEKLKIYQDIATQFKNGWQSARSRIAVKIGDEAAIKAKAEFIANVAAMHDIIRIDLNTLFKELSPSDNRTEAVNKKISEIFTNLADMRDMIANHTEK